MATGIGETLRAARRQQTISLADAAAATRVRESYLAALEQEEFEALGGDVYVKGFLRSYAKYLALDPEPLLATYRREHERPEETGPIPRRGAKRPVSVGRDQPSPFAVVLAVVVVLLVLLVGLRVFGGGDDELPQDPDPVPGAPTDVAPHEPAVDPAPDAP